MCLYIYIWLLYLLNNILIAFIQHFHLFSFDIKFVLKSKKILKTQVHISKQIRDSLCILNKMRLLTLWKERTGNRVRDVHIYKIFHKFILLEIWFVFEPLTGILSNAVLFPAIYIPVILWSSVWAPSLRTERRGGDR